MLKNFSKKLDEISMLHNEIQNQLANSNISSEKRINLSKKFASLEQILECTKMYADNIEIDFKTNNTKISMNSNEKVLIKSTY